ncbi:MAG: hypothetical protein KAS07_06165, partial [Candidatus Pacebacteria bacterium]|nr:hypothetical protein [Candidatus Paceibacterota bacterium]
MEVLLSFIIKNIEGYTDRKIQKDFPEDMPFIDVIQEILKIINSSITLDKIAVISAVKGLFTYDDIRKSVKEIVDLHLLEFTITKRDLVNGSNLMLKDLISTTSEEDSSKDMQFGYLKPKIEPEAPPQPEAIPDLKPLESEIMKEKLEDFDRIGSKSDELSGELQFPEMEKVKSTRNEIDDAKEAIDRMEEMLRKPSEEDQLLEPLEKSQEKEIALPPPGSALKSPLNQQSEVTEDLKKIFSEAMERKKVEPPVGPPSGPSAGFPAPKSAPPPGSAPGGHPKSPQSLRGVATEELKSLFKIKEEKKSGPPGGPPSGSPGDSPISPLTLRYEMKKELNRLRPKIKDEKKSESPSVPPVSGSGAPPPSPVPSRPLAKPSIQEPTPPPPPVSLSSESAKKSVSLSALSPKKKKKGKKMAARSRSFAKESEETAPVLKEDIKDEAIVDDFEGHIEEAEEVEEVEEVE